MHVKKPFKLTMTPMLAQYLIKFAMRIAIFVAVFVFYLYDKTLLLELMTTPITKRINALHVLWLIFMGTMLLHLFPSEKRSMALLKGRRENYVQAKGYQRLALLEYVHSADVKAWVVMLFWLCFNAIWGILFLLNVIDTADLLMLTVFYYLSDYICILLFCPFQTNIMKNKCCINCRIYDWGHFMMFTPMLFIKDFFSWSLFFTSCVVLIHWELVYAKHPERFWEGSNQTLRCANCKDKTCQLKKKLSGR